MTKYYDHRTPAFDHDTEKERVRNLSTDKRVKHIEYCDTCGAPMSKHKYDVNQGLCDNCIAAIN